MQSSGEAAPTVDLEPSSEGQLLADGTLMDVTWSDYESLYAQWKTGLVDDSTVRQAGGLNLLDLMQTQYILDVDESQDSSFLLYNDDVLLNRGTCSLSDAYVYRVPAWLRLLSEYCCL